MKVLFPVLVLCTAAVVAVVLAIHFRVKRHLREQPPTGPSAEPAEIQGQTDAGSSTVAEDVKNNH